MPWIEISLIVTLCISIACYIYRLLRRKKFGVQEFIGLGLSTTSVVKLLNLLYFAISSEEMRKLLGTDINIVLFGIIVFILVGVQKILQFFK